MSYLWAGYLLTWIAVVVYAWRLEARRAAEERRLAFVRDRGRSDDEPAPPGGS